MNHKAWLVLHMKLVEGGERAVPHRISIHSEDAESLTTVGGNNCSATLLTGLGTSFEEACNDVLNRIAVSIRIRGHGSNYRWMLPLMLERDRERINDILDEIDKTYDYIGRYELENDGSQPKPR